MRLNLGCGYRKIEGFINIDCDRKVNPDVVLDIMGGLPYEDGSVDEVICEQVLEHLLDYTFVIDEIHRVLKEGGIAYISVPHKDCTAAYGDPNHVRFFVMDTLLHYGDSRWYQPSNFYGHGMFDIIDGAIVKWKNPEEDASVAGKYFTELIVKMKKVNKDYWKDKEKKSFRNTTYILNRGEDFQL